MDKKKLDFEKDHYEKLWKIPILLLLSLGLYFIYWEYHTWKFVKREKQSNISPGWRVVAGIFPMITFIMLYYDILTIVSDMKRKTAIICAIIWTLIYYVGPDISPNNFQIHLFIYGYFFLLLPIIIFQYLINQYVLKLKEI